MLLNCGVGEDSWESLGLQGDPTSPFWRRSVLGAHWKDWCWSWNSSTLATWCKELTHWKRPWCWQGLRAGGEGDDRGWDGWMASPTQWTWIWVNSRSWWWTGRPGMLQSMGSQRVRHNWATELNWQVSSIQDERESFQCGDLHNITGNTLGVGGVPGGSVVKNLSANSGDTGSIPGSGRSLGEGNGNPFQYSCLGNSVDRGAWQATVHGVARVGHELVTKSPPPPMNDIN